MSSDLISRSELKKSLNEMFDTVEVMLFDDIIAKIDNAPTVKSYTLEDLEKAKNNGYKWGRIDGRATARPQGELAEKLKDRIEESVCRYCPKMNRHCELCEISQVFSIIELTNEEMKGGES